ncbi:hypothetical protein SAMN02746065_12224 [Desulfocicer vacuolatum DSM 3385]|uniref:Uncharacterized protein n=1 Tax=Desulfocicer vacuolatum DSM 3385 TaxID=1121400 RepID=A0A1W2E023_9BACT|nr:hypothetical protein SAMN02746065_12224 [Desulfocicer vacuolatum DSM 3385]
MCSDLKDLKCFYPHRFLMTQFSGFISKPAFLNVPMGSVCRRGQAFVIDVIDQGLCQRKKPR